MNIGTIDLINHLQNQNFIMEQQIQKNKDLTEKINESNKSGSK